MTFAGVLPGVDLVVTVNEDATGFSEVLRVESPEAAPPDLAALTSDVGMSDCIDLQASDGGFVAADASGEPVFTSPVPTMWDPGSVTPGRTGDHLDEHRLELVRPGPAPRRSGTQRRRDPGVQPLGSTTSPT